MTLAAIGSAFGLAYVCGKTAMLVAWSIGDGERWLSLDAAVQAVVIGCCLILTSVGTSWSSIQEGRRQAAQARRIRASLRTLHPLWKLVTGAVPSVVLNLDRHSRVGLRGRRRELQLRQIRQITEIQDGLRELQRGPWPAVAGEPAPEAVAEAAPITWACRNRSLAAAGPGGVETITTPAVPVAGITTTEADVPTETAWLESVSRALGDQARIRSLIEEFDRVATLSRCLTRPSGQPPEPTYVPPLLEMREPCRYFDRTGNATRAGTGIRTMDPDADHEAVYRLTAMVEMPWEMRFGWNLAFYRPFAVPRMAALLARTGQIEKHTTMRAHDTGLMMYEIIEQGLSHPRSLRIISRLNAMHHRWPIAPEDYRYMLTTFAVVPTRFVQRYGWRPQTEVEQRATHRFYQRLGEMLEITRIPGSYPEMAAYLDAYEAANVRPSAEGERLTAATLPLLAARLPGPLKERAGEVAAVFLSRPLRAALGLPAPRRTTQVMIGALLSARAASMRRRPPATQSWFTPGMPGTAHPEGYELSELGVEAD